MNKKGRSQKLYFTKMTFFFFWQTKLGEGILYYE